MSQEYYEKTAALRCLEPPDSWVEDFGICKQCNINPCSRKSEPHICDFCICPRDVQEKCYNCDKCIATRAYLEETKDDFVFKGYQGQGPYQAEIWQCKNCLYCFSIQHLVPSIMRDVLHENGRKWHKKYYCDDLKSGKSEVTFH